MNNVQNPAKRYCMQLSFNSVKDHLYITSAAKDFFAEVYIRTVLREISAIINPLLTLVSGIR